MQFSNVEQALAQFLQESPLNIVPELGSMRIYDTPLVGVADAGDILFGRLKEEQAVGQQHLSPREWLPSAQSVISWFLPFSQKVRTANRQGALPAAEWLYGRIEGEMMNNALRKFLVEWLQQAGYQAVAPALDSRMAVVNRRSNWSERHVGFVAGLGTFSLSRSFISKKGSAGRLGSVITSLKLEPTPRDYETFDANCSRCGACIRRCPPKAIDENGKDNAICSNYLDEMLARYKPRYGCGKCQTGVPCEERAPKERQSISG